MRTIDTDRQNELHELHVVRPENHGTRNALLIGGAILVLAIGGALALQGNNNLPEGEMAGNVSSPAPVTPGASTSGSIATPRPPAVATTPTPARPRPAASNLVTIPQGTPVTVELRNEIGTKHSRVGDTFTAVVAQSVSANGRTAIPAGSTVNGRVILSEQPGKASGRGKLQLQFNTVSINGRSYDLGSRSAVFESKSGTEKDVAIIGGGAAAGGVAGAILGKDAGSAAKGAAIGGAAGTVASLLTRGPQLTLEPGTNIRFTLDQPVAVRPPSNTNS
ncbi:MAG TPA: hypothetical protein VF720_02885 [Candidatus Eisenbacteria bacterium]